MNEMFYSFKKRKKKKVKISGENFYFCNFLFYIDLILTHHILIINE